MSEYCATQHHDRFTAIFPGPPGWAGAGRELLDFMVQGKINRSRHNDHPAGRRFIRTKQCALPPSRVMCVWLFTWVVCWAVLVQCHMCHLCCGGWRLDEFSGCCRCWTCMIRACMMCMWVITDICSMCVCMSAAISRSCSTTWSTVTTAASLRHASGSGEYVTES